MRRIASLLALVFLAASPALAGPPWISVEYPVNPFHQDTRGALALVHTFHHGVAMQFPVTARAEGYVGGKRVSIPLQVSDTYRRGVHAVRGELPKGGTAWVLVFDLTDTETTYRASAMLALDGNGQLAGVEVPRRGIERNPLTPRLATNEDVDAMLRRTLMIARATAGRQPDLGMLPGAAALIGLLGLGGVAAARRAS